MIFQNRKRNRCYMGYKLDNGLSPSPTVIEFADYWEIECLKKHDQSASILDIVKSKGILDDVQETEVDESDIELESLQQDVVNEILRREEHCGGKYPFLLSVKGYVLSINREHDEKSVLLYLYLLLCTRNNMTEHKSIHHLDGTKIFEQLSRDVLVNFLGVNSKGLIFGTSNGSKFYDNLEELKNSIHDGSLSSEYRSLSYSPQDDKLDVVAWKPFNDRLPSKLICFAQCKTGTHWVGTLEQLNVSSFLKKWFARHPALNPIRTFLIADVLPPDDFYNRSVNSLFFDRCRLMYYSFIPSKNDWFSSLSEWTIGIMENNNLRIK